MPVVVIMNNVLIMSMNGSCILHLYACALYPPPTSTKILT
jgi:hypothetical protein